MKQFMTKFRPNGTLCYRIIIWRKSRKVSNSELMHYFDINGINEPTMIGSVGILFCDFLKMLSDRNINTVVYYPDKEKEYKRI